MYCAILQSLATVGPSPEAPTFHKIYNSGSEKIGFVSESSSKDHGMDSSECKETHVLQNSPAVKEVWVPHSEAEILSSARLCHNET